MSVATEIPLLKNDQGKIVKINFHEIKSPNSSLTLSKDIVNLKRKKFLFFAISPGACDENK
jgi:hypothetical protein